VSAVEQGVGEDGYIFGGREQARVSGNAAEDARVFVLHLALDDSVAEGAIVGGWRDGVLHCKCGSEGRVRHAERAEDFALAERVERFVGEAFEDDAENDEADVAVFGAGTGSRCKGCCEGGLQKVFAGLGAQKKLFVRRQAGAVREQHTQSDFAAAVVTLGELAREVGDDGGDRGFEIEQAAFVENHGHGRRGHDFGERSEIEDVRCGDLGRSRIVCEAAEGLVGYELSPEGDRERAGGEGTGDDGSFQDAEGARKPIILRDEIAHEEGKPGFSIRQRQIQGCFVN